jgi:hypothetical protein
MKICLFLSCLVILSLRAELPIWPTTPDHPSSQNYRYSFSKETYQVERRDIVVFKPIAIDDSNQKNFPVLVYGHGQALGLDAYEKTFIHLAQKGIGVIFPQYDKGFFDQDWKRMGRDYVNLTADALKRFSSFDPNEVVFSGHSKGAYIALMAAGTPNALIKPKSLLLFTPAGYDEDYLTSMDPLIKVSAIWPQGDRVIKIVDKSPADFKQFIEVGSYSDFNPGHFFTLHKRKIFGGRDGVNAFHFFGVWPWAFGAAKKEGSDYLYGDLARDMGVSNNAHLIERY